MAYRFALSDPTVEAAVRRMAAELFDAAIAAAEAGAADFHKRVHGIRTSCKRLRGLLRLVSDACPQAEAENVAIRDIAALLSAVREAGVAIATFDSLALAASKAGPDSGRVRRALANDERAARREAKPAFAGIAALLRDARARAEHWSVDKHEFDAIERGLVRTLKRASKSLAKAEARSDPLDFHAFRKRVKDHSYHARLLRDIRPQRLKPYAEVVEQLGDRLGEHHDLAMLELRLAEKDLASIDIRRIRRALVKCKVRLEDEALRLGAVLFDEPAKPRARRWGRRWAKWRESVR